MLTYNRHPSFSTFKRARVSLQTAIPFDIEVINIGNAMDITSGVFTAPKNGIYFFSLSGLANMNNGLFYVTLAKNGQPVGRSSVVLPVAAVS